MSAVPTSNEPNVHKEFPAKVYSGMLLLLIATMLTIVSLIGFIYGIVLVEASPLSPLGFVLLILGAVCGFIVGPFLFVGLKIVKPNEARVFTLFGRYTGTLRTDGFYWVNPFTTSIKPPRPYSMQSSSENTTKAGETQLTSSRSSTLSLKTMTFTNDKQKINDLMGNPIIISIVVIWRVTETAKALFSVDNYFEFLSVQSDSALRNIVRMYPYDSSESESTNEKSLRGSSQEIAENLRQEIQSKVEVAGLEVTEARITHLAYAPEIAAAMLQRQQASAIVDARQLIVEGAVGMVQMALAKLKEKDVVELDEERKAAMVSNLMVVLCGNKDAQPIVNSGSLY